MHLDCVAKQVRNSNILTFPLNKLKKKIAIKNSVKNLLILTQYKFKKK